MGHAACALGCADRGCSGCGTSTQVVEVEVASETLSSRPRHPCQQANLESWHGTTSSAPAPLEVRPVKGDERAKGSHLAPLPTLHLDMPAAVAAAFLESTKAEADAKHRRKLACRAARQEAAQSRPAEWRAGPQPTGPVRPTVALDSPRDLQPLGLDGKFVSSGAIRQRLQEMEDASFSNRVR
ncbi:unnamed protein product [Durusdinium trenchii]|uniref:Uncharacterized protein n=1 Tax=Durusdinium trenchii TaxID=1381693 RepID=A0ABP0HLG6_9DINO